MGLEGQVAVVITLLTGYKVLLRQIPVPVHTGVSIVTSLAHSLSPLEPGAASSPGGRGAVCFHTAPPRTGIPRLELTPATATLSQPPPPPQLKHFIDTLLQFAVLIQILNMDWTILSL